MTSIWAYSLGRRYGKKWGLKDASFEVSEGELAVLAGPNGAGKTTTVRILATILKPSKGEARVLGYDVVKEFKEIRKRIAYMPQGYRGSTNLTPYEAVKWNLVARGWSFRKASAQAEKWLKLLGLWEDRNKTGWALSGGQRVRVAVAATLACNADVIFLDEPTVGLDVDVKHAVWRAIREIVSGGASVLLTTHDMYEAEILADQVIFLFNGKTIVAEEPQKLVELLPYRYKVAVKGKELLKNIDVEDKIDLGDRAIVYAKSEREAIRLIEEIGFYRESLSISRVGLEDVFYFFTKRRGGINV